jgi:RimJ/RimL family protein N-acetyltransferase
VVLEGAKVVLRPVQAEDLLSIMRWEQDDEVTCFIGKKVDAYGTCEEWFVRSLADPRRRLMSIDTTAGRFIGNIELTHISRKSGAAEVAAMIGEKDCWGLGYGTEAMSLILTYSFAELGLRRVYLRVYTSNRRAIRCYEKCGFRKEGIMPPSARQTGRVGPVLLMSIDRATHLAAVRERRMRVDRAPRAGIYS